MRSYNNNILKFSTLNILLPFILLITSVNAFGQNQGNLTYNWAKSAFTDSTGGRCSGAAIVRDSLGNLYVAGTYTGLADFDPSIAVNKLSSASTNDDIFLAKYAANGTFIYAKSLSGIGTKTIGGLALDKSGFIYLCGGFNGSIDFDPSATVYTLSSTGTADDAFIAKYSFNGSFIYANRIGSATTEMMNGIAVNRGGNVFVCGFFTGTSDFDPGVGVTNLTSTGSLDIFFAKYSSTGALVYAKNAGGTSGEYASAIALGKNSAVHLTGQYTGICDFDPSLAAVTLTSSSNSQDIFIAKYDSTGNYVYAKSMGGTSNDIGYSIKADTAGTVYICGMFQTTADMDPSTSSYNLFTSNSSSGFIAHYSTVGNFIYAQPVINGFTSTNYSALNSIAIDQYNMAYVTGFLVTSAVPSPLTSSIVVAKYNPAGTNVYYQTLAGFSGCNGRGIAADTLGNCYIAGVYNLQLDADPSAGTYYLNAPATDGLVLGYNSTGNMLFANSLGTYYASGVCAPYRIKRDAAGNSYVIGNINGAYNFDPGVKQNSAISSASLGPGYTAMDVFFAKYNAAGSLVWSRVIGGPGIDNGYDIAISNSGAVYITGTIQRVADFDPSPAVYTLTSLYNTYNAFIAKYDQNGNFIFAKTMGGDYGMFAFTITLDALSNVYISGDFKGNCDFDPSPATYTLNAYGTTFNAQYDCYFAKYDSLGNFIYVRQIGNTNGDGNTFLSLDPAGNVYISGQFSDQVDFDLSPTSAYSLSASGGADNFFAKYRSNGTFVYAKNLPLLLINANKVDKDGNLYLSGSFNGTVDFDPSPATASIVNSPSGSSVFFAKYDSLGNYIFAKGLQIPSTSFEGIDLAFDTLGSIYVTGAFPGTVDFDPSPNGLMNLSANGNKETYIAKYSPNGSYVYAKTIGGAADEKGTSIAVSPDGSNVNVSGYFYSTADLDPGSGVAAFNANNQMALFVASYSSCLFPYSQTPLNSLTFCAGNSVSLTAQASGSLTWYATATTTNALGSGSLFVTPTLATGNYSYFIESSACNSGRSSITVTVNPLPNISLPTANVCSGSSYTLIPSGASTYTISGGSFVFTPSTNVTYTVSGTSAAGCISASAAIGSLSLIPLPTVAVINGTICSGQSFTLQPSGALNYTYSSGTAVVSPLSNTVYSISGADQYGCLSANAATVGVFVNTTPSLAVSNGSICLGSSFSISPTGASSYSYSGGSALVSPVLTSTYLVSGASANACVGNATVMVTVNPLPTVSINSGSICAGANFSLIPSGAFTYSVSGSNWLVSPTATSFYSVTGTSALGCVSSNTAVSSVQVFSLPVISASGGSVCAGASFTIQATGASTYSYSGGTAIVTPPLSSSYSISGTSSNGCVSFSPVVITVNVLPLPVISVNNSVICSGNTVTINPSGASSYTYSSGSAIVSPMQTTVYTVTGQGPNSCRSAVNVSITVNISPSISINSGSVCSGNSFALIPSGANSYTISGGSFTVNPLQSSTYTLTGMSNQSCPATNTAIATISVMPLPTITVNSGSICSGQSFVILPGGAQSYTYSGGTATVSPLTTSNYSVLGSTNYGCISGAPAISTVLVKASPALTVSSSASIICAGETLTLSAYGADTYTWSNGLMTPFIVEAPQQTMTYTLNGSDSSGCNSSVLITQIVNACTGIKDVESDVYAISVYPNPNNGNFIVEMKGKGEAALYNSIGQCVANYILVEGLNSISETSFSKGIYFLHIKIDSRIKVFKLTIQD